MSRLSVRILPWLAATLLLAVAVISWATGGIVHELLRADISGPDRIARLQQLFRQLGVLAPLTYVAFVVVEVVVAPIPGLMLYAPGGLIFGPWLGGSLALAGNVIGAGISCGMTRSLGMTRLKHVTGDARVEALQGILEHRGDLLIILLRLNPLTSTDLLSYAAGFTRIPIWRVMLSTGIGLAPLCFIQSWLSDSLFNKWPWLLWPLLAFGVVYVVVVALIVNRMLRPNVSASESNAQNVHLNR
jgi:uncharacterized membrane protein YdjX (TVP38/TMEM64 family)